MMGRTVSSSIIGWWSISSSTIRWWSISSSTIRWWTISSSTIRWWSISSSTFTRGKIRRLWHILRFLYSYTTQPNSYLSRRIHIFIYFQSAPTRALIYHKKSPLSPPFPFSLDSIIWKQTVKNQPTTITLSNELQYLDSSIIHDHIVHLKISIFRSLFRLEFNKSITQRVIGKLITNDLMIAPSFYYPYLTTCHSKSFKN